MRLTCTNCHHEFIRDDKRKLGSTRLCYICNADRKDRVPQNIQRLVSTPWHGVDITSNTEGRIHDIMENSRHDPL